MDGSCERSILRSALCNAETSGMYVALDEIVIETYLKVKIGERGCIYCVRCSENNVLL